jgi:hypothetical protein
LSNRALSLSNLIEKNNNSAFQGSKQTQQKRKEKKKKKGRLKDSTCSSAPSNPG